MMEIARPSLRDVPHSGGLWRPTLMGLKAQKLSTKYKSKSFPKSIFGLNHFNITLELTGIWEYCGKRVGHRILSIWRNVRSEWRWNWAWHGRDTRRVGSYQHCGRFRPSVVMLLLLLVGGGGEPFRKGRTHRKAARILIHWWHGHFWNWKTNKTQ